MWLTALVAVSPASLAHGGFPLSNDPSDLAVCQDTVRTAGIRLASDVRRAVSACLTRGVECLVGDPGARAACCALGASRCAAELDKVDTAKQRFRRYVAFRRCDVVPFDDMLGASGLDYESLGALCGALTPALELDDLNALTTCLARSITAGTSCGIGTHELPRGLEALRCLGLEAEFATATDADLGSCATSGGTSGPTPTSQSETPTPGLPTATATSIATVVPSATATATPLPATPIRTATATVVPATPTATVTANVTGTPAITTTPAPTITATPSGTAHAATATPTALATPTHTATATVVATTTSTPVVTATPLVTTTPQATATAQPTAARTATAVPTTTATVTAVPTATTTAGSTATATAASTATATTTPHPTVTPGCGNGVIDPGEDCDDGNTSNCDSCPSNCKTLQAPVACPTAGRFTQKLDITPPSDNAMTGGTFCIDYPVGTVALPGTGSVPSRVTGIPGGLPLLNDFNNAVQLSFVANPARTEFTPTISFDLCKNATAPLPTAFHCVTTFADNEGTSFDPPSQVTCVPIAP